MSRRFQFSLGSLSWFVLVAAVNLVVWHLFLERFLWDPKPEVRIGPWVDLPPEKPPEFPFYCKLLFVPEPPLPYEGPVTDPAAP